MDLHPLLDREDRAWQALLAACEDIPPERRQLPGVVPGWSTHDLLFHCAFWADYAGQMLERIRQGDPDPDDFDGPESEILEAGRAMPWNQVLERAEEGRKRARAALEALSDLPQRAFEWFEDDTYDHFDEHAAQVRAYAATTPS